MCALGERGMIAPAVSELALDSRSLIASSNKPSASGRRSAATGWPSRRWVDCLVHHAEVIVVKPESYRLVGERQEVLSEKGR